MNKYLILLATLATTVRADIIKLTDLSIEATQNIHSSNNSTLEYPYEERYGLNLNLGLRAGKYLYNRSKVLSLTDNRAFKYIALESELGAEIGQFDIGVYHKSGHMLDSKFNDSFRDDNRLFIRVHLFREK